MQLRPYWPALLLVIAGAGALRARRPAPAAAPVASASSSVAASRIPPLEVGAGKVESELSPRTVHGGPARRHRATGRGPTRAQVAWRREIGAPIEAQVTTSPDGAASYVVTLAGDLIALATATGEELWRKPQGDRVYVAPTVLRDGMLVLGRDGGAVLAVSPEGASKWRFETEQDCDVAVTELFSGELLSACGQRLLLLRQDGTLKAEAQVPKKIFSTPAAGSSLVVVGSQDGHVRGYQRGTLTPVFDTALGADVDGGVTLGEDDSVFVGTDAGEVVKLDATGVILWRQKIGSYVRGVLSLARNGDVLAGAMGAEPAQVRLRGDTGAVVFRAKTRGTGALEFGIRGGALEDDAGHLYFGAQDDAVYALEGNGEPLFRFETKGDVDAPLTLLPDGRLLIASSDGSVTCLAP